VLFFSLVILKLDATERPSIIWKKKSGFFKRFGKTEFSSKMRQTAAKRRPNVGKNDGRGKRRQNGGRGKRRPNGGQTLAKMTAVENGGKTAAKRRQIGGELAAKRRPSTL
jgi:hypothetical protein